MSVRAACPAPPEGVAHVKNSSAALRADALTVLVGCLAPVAAHAASETPAGRVRPGRRLPLSPHQAKRSMRTVTALPPMSMLFIVSTAAVASAAVGNDTVPKPLQRQEAEVGPNILA